MVAIFHPEKIRSFMIKSNVLEENIAFLNVVDKIILHVVGIKMLGFVVEV